ncbi:MAG TPA: Sir2 family NAD-dependent protein deacetylase, partial [Candidatus Acidoferrum sp.]|nr:Sir2 family NAD-dependent protein deacetylase [Candidatus Acidoferrum sp.]
LRTARCTGCDERVPIDSRGLALDSIEHACGGRMRPDIVWFGESLPRETWERACAAADRAEVILVVGTSAVVYPAAALATRGNAFVTEVNPQETAISDRVDCVVRGTAAQALPGLVNAL